MAHKRGKMTISKREMLRRAPISINGVQYGPVDESEVIWRPRLRGQCTPRAYCERCDTVTMYPDFEDPYCASCGDELLTNRPCPFVGCKHNTFCDVTKRGSLRLNFPNLQPWEVPPHLSCALDLAEEPMTLEETAQVLYLVKERVRQIQDCALERFRQDVEFVSRCKPEHNL